MKFVVLNDDEEKRELTLVSEKPIIQDITVSIDKDCKDVILALDNICKELDRVCKETTEIEEARNMTVEDIANSRYFEDEKKQKIIFRRKRKL